MGIDQRTFFYNHTLRSFPHSQFICTNMERTRYYTPTEVRTHHRPTDIWLSFLGKVYDLTSLTKTNPDNILVQPIIANGGKDISHWFDKKTKDLRKFVDPVTGCEFYHTPYGRIIHTPPLCPRTDWCNDFGRPWWMMEQTYCVGALSQSTRNIKIINTLTSQSQVL